MAKKPKLSKSEKLDRDIRLAYRKQERAMDMLKKGERMLKTSASDLARLHKAKRRHEAQAEPVPPPTPDHSGVIPTATDGQLANDGTVSLAQLGETKIGKANRESWNAANPIPPHKPKRQRKPKPEPAMDDPNHPDLVAASAMLKGINAAMQGKPVDREAKMKAMGFRKTSNRRKPDSV